MNVRPLSVVHAQPTELNSVEISWQSCHASHTSSANLSRHCVLRAAIPGCLFRGMDSCYILDSD